MATRLQADSDGKEAKWADIDDDEDDWAPEAIEWNDGTKITLAQNDTAASLAEERAASQRLGGHPEELQEKESQPPIPQKPTTTVGPNATILKPRSAAQSKTGTGIVLKTPSEKPSLVSKPAAPTPVRSPWATLPPVEKIPPISINPEQASGPARPPPQYDAISAQQILPPAPPAMEIAADSFSRSRDGANGNVGQLYNAQSGRYEPANTGRRGSVRKDQSFRPPSVLQRGSNSTIEVSTAIQGRTGSQGESGGWPRRGSSNVSGESGQFGRRASMSKSVANGIMDERRGSQSSQAVQTPTTPAPPFATISVDGSSGPVLPNSAAQSPALQHAQIADTRSNNASPSHAREDIITQRKVMTESARIAKARKQEEEKVEEAARRERIRLKMESMGLAPLPEKKEIPHSQQQELKDKSSSEEPKLEEKSVEKKTTVQDSKQAVASPENQKNAAPKSPPKPPVPDASGAPQQYGMIKMHGPATSGPPQHDTHRVQMERNKTHILPQAQNSRVGAGTQAPPAVDRTPSPLVNGIKHEQPSPAKTPEIPGQGVSREPRQQPWNDLPKDQKMLAAWGSATNTRDRSTGANNVWGAPAQSRSLGNGTFERGPQLGQPRSQEQFSSPSLAPIGPPKPAQVHRESRDGVKPSDETSIPSLEDSQPISNFPSQESLAQAARLEPIGRPTSTDDRVLSSQHTHGLQTRPQYTNLDNKPQNFEQQKASLAAWGNFHSAIDRDDALKRQQQTARLADETRAVGRYEPQLPVMHETWRQVKVDDQSTQRSIISVSHGQNTPGQPPAPHVSLDTREVPFAPQVTMAPSVLAGIGRGSRFFPSAGRTTLHPYAQSLPFTPGYRRGSSPPPPDSDFHPAFSRDQPRPKVTLPIVNPKPKVRLPPPISSAVQPPKTPDPQSLPVSVNQQPTSHPSSWKDKINGLFGHKKFPEKTFANPTQPYVSVGFSSTREPLASPIIQASAAVSLPHIDGLNIPTTLRVDSKDVVDEETLFTPESGSLPIALLPPRDAHKGFSATRAWKRGPPKQIRPSKEIEALSRDALLEVATMGNGGLMVFIRLKGMMIPKSKTMSKTNGQTEGAPFTVASQLHSRNFSSNSKISKAGFKLRQSSGNFSPNNRSNQGLGPTAIHPSSGHPKSQAPSNVASPAWGSTFVH